jgi:hypothetical protein
MDDSPDWIFFQAAYHEASLGSRAAFMEDTLIKESFFREGGSTLTPRQYTRTIGRPPYCHFSLQERCNGDDSPR